MRTLNRKTVGQTLGVAGLGLGLLVSAVGAPSAMAQETGSPGIDRQLFQNEDDLANLSDEELKQLLIQLLQERVQEKDGDLAFQGDEAGKDAVIARLQDGEDEGDHEGRRAVFHRLPDGGEGFDPAAFEAQRVEAYNAFTQALADELNIDDPDEVDAAIRAAMMAVVDSHVEEGALTRDQAEELKSFIAKADAPMGVHSRMAIIAEGPLFIPVEEGGSGIGG